MVVQAKKTKTTSLWRLVVENKSVNEILKLQVDLGSARVEFASGHPEPAGTTFLRTL
jgi:hypothetical protein